MKTATRGIDAIFYLTKDLPRAKSFYESVLGLRLRRKYDDRACEFELADGSAFGLGHQPDFWMQSGGVLFAVDDVDESLERVKLEGGSVLKLPVQSDMCRIAWCSDTEGNTFALHHRDSRTDDEEQDSIEDMH